MRGIMDFYSKFNLEQACMDYLEKMRWEDKPCCPRYNRLWKCGGCKRQFTVRIGKILEESKLLLRKWFLVIFLATSLEKVISSLQLSKYLGLTQKTSLAQI